MSHPKLYMSHLQEITTAEIKKRLRSASGAREKSAPGRIRLPLYGVCSVQGNLFILAVSIFKSKKLSQRNIWVRNVKTFFSLIMFYITILYHF